MMETLANWIWQGALLAGIAAVAIGRVRRFSAASRHILWWAALAGVLALPLLYRVPQQAAAISLPSAASFGISSARAPFLPELPAPPSWLAPALLMLWAGSVLTGSIRLIRGLLQLRLMKRSSSPLLPDERGLPQQLAWCDVAEVRVSDEISTPCAAGLGRPVILLPRLLVDRLSARDLRLVVLHEQAHLSRRDDWGRLLQALIRIVAGLHPAVRWVSSRIDAEREAACDELVVSATGSAAAYSSCLANVASASAEWGLHARAAASLVPGAVSGGMSLEDRVRRILERRHRFGSRGGRIALAAGLASLAILASLVSVPRLEMSVVRAPASTLASSATAPTGPNSPAASMEPAGVQSEVPAVRVPSRRNLSGRPVRQARATTAPPAQENAQAVVLDEGASAVGGLALARPGSPELSVAPRQDFIQHPVSVTAGPVPGTLAGTATARGNDATSAPDWAGPWVATGRQAQKAGIAVSGFFSRTGRSIAGAFQ